MKNSSSPIRNQTHDLLACSAVPQPTPPLHMPHATVVVVTAYLQLINLTLVQANL